MYQISFFIAKVNEEVVKLTKTDIHGSAVVKTLHGRRRRDRIDRVDNVVKYEQPMQLHHEQQHLHTANKLKQERQEVRLCRTKRGLNSLN